MKISNLQLKNFKNYDELKLRFSQPVTCIVGNNGSGKTNLIDAVYLLGNTKSAFSTVEAQSIQEGQSYYLVEGQFKEDLFSVKVYFENGQKKIVRFNDDDYEKLTQHIGKVPVVMSNPLDLDIIRGTGDVRRKWIDGCISPHEPDYLEALVKYQRILRQRNALLKRIRETGKAQDLQLLDTYDEEMVRYAFDLTEGRRSFLINFDDHFIRNMEALVGNKDKCSITYSSQVKENFRDVLHKMRDKDLFMQRSTVGAHRDDLQFLMKGQPIRRFGSQGQQKSFLIALRLAQFDYLSATKNDAPILLLDDVFDKLDDHRIKGLLKILEDRNRFEQVILTDARKERTLSLFGEDPNLQIVEISKGKIVNNE